MNLLQVTQELHRRHTEGGCFTRYFHTPEERVKYPHWMSFFAADYFERLAMAANQVGKSTAGLFEVTCHLTGLYPDWWVGHRFDSGNAWWLGGINHDAIKEALQDRLLGPVGDFGTGFIPKAHLDFESLKDAKKSATGVKMFRVKHVSGTFSTVTLKSYKEGREAWQAKPGTSILLDEEPPMAIYTEALMRAAVGDTRMMLTFTPIKGMSDVTMSFLNGDALHPAGELTKSRHLTRATWYDCPHLTPEKIEALMAGIPKYQRDARSKGIPTLGAGAIFQVSEETVFCEPFQIPLHWPKSYGMDVGWNRTAAVWGAIDPDSDTHYIYSEHYLGEELPNVHALAIKARGDWIKGAMDPASRGRGQDDGQRLFEQYRDLGLHLTTADNAVSAPLWEMEEAMEQGRFKIFNTCSNLRMEYRLYSRDEKGKIVKKNDHALDAMRYWWNTGRGLAATKARSTSSSATTGLPMRQAW